MKKNSTKTSTPATKFHSDFSTCSKNKDFTGAITLFDYAISQNLKLNLHHLNCFLYICANSTESFGALAIEKGFHIYNYMISSKINPNEATITAVSRLAAANNDADYSFELVKSLGNYNVKPRLRTYDAALFCYVKLLDAEKAYAVEDDMLTLGLCLEEPEISALLKVSVEVGDAEKVLAVEREKRSNFTQFQNWLDQHNDFEAIVDAANIGLYQQNFADGGFSVPQLEAVVKELYNRSNKWPLVILHEKRLHTLLANPCNREILQEWIDNGILYGTPVGSNDDWYWLYASVKLKCMLVTNDEMRDHIFELLGSNFFPRWKERHQVHYAFPKGQLKLEMPPSYSIVIQESERGAWHVPVTGEYKDESQRTWLCVTRPETCNASDEFAKSAEARESGKMINGNDLNPCSNSLNNSETICITGKRKERSESPTE
ncbi:putative ribonuclease P [Helianthus annuus]|nr:putative ribonuclease P [Helianthus annuus]